MRTVSFPLAVSLKTHKAMIDSEGIVKIGTVDGVIRGISIADLQTSIGTSYNDIGRIIAEGGINKWAKHKPFRYNTPGFPLDRTQSTPELRSPERMTRLLAANYGLSIPKYGANDFKTHYSEPWTYLRPRGLANNEHFRFPDFDGYLHNNYWNPGPVGDRGIYTIFSGYFGVPNNTVFAGDTIQFGIQCAEDPDGGVLGLLYPYDFLREMQHNDDLSKYYMGIALLDSQSRLWVITGDRMDAHHSMYDVSASLVSTIPNNVADGALKAIPILASSQYPTWDNAPGMGYFISLDGQYLSLTKSSSTRKLVIDVEVIYNNPGVTLNFSIRNQSSSAVTVSNLYGFLMSMAAESNEPDDGYPAPAYIDPGVFGFIDSNWPSASLDTPPSFPLLNGPDIHVSDWAPSYPNYLAARAYNARTDFRANNNNSDIIASGATVTWTKTFPNISEDDFGSYAEYMRFALCVRVSPDAPYTAIFIADN